MSLEEITARLAAEHRAMKAPVSLEHAVLAEFDANRRRGRWRVGAAAVVAGALAAGGILIWERPTPRATPIAGVSRPVVAHTAAAVPGVKVPAPKRAVPRPILHTSIPRVVDAPTEMPFIAIPFTAPLAPDENVRIVRITLSASALAAVGFPLPVTDPLAGTPSDVLVGEDGRARAIRILQNSTLH